eukprot:1143541-Pelagomonas_calceolata.AAC.1
MDMPSSLPHIFRSLDLRNAALPKRLVKTKVFATAMMHGTPKKLRDRTICSLLSMCSPSHVCSPWGMYIAAAALRCVAPFQHISIGLGSGPLYALKKN